MATEIIYTYCVGAKNLKLYLKGCMKIYFKVKDVNIDFLYDEESNTAHLEHFIEGIPKPDYEISEFIKLPRLFGTPSIFYIVTKTKYIGIQIISSKKIISWSKTISELENKGLVETKPSSMVLATDPRCFRFVKDPDDVMIEVDCLGTRFCEDITNKVENLFLACEK